MGGEAVKLTLVQYLRARVLNYAFFLTNDLSELAAVVVGLGPAESHRGRILRSVFGLPQRKAWLTVMERMR